MHYEEPMRKSLRAIQEAMDRECSAQMKFFMLVTEMTRRHDERIPLIGSRLSASLWSDLSPAIWNAIFCITERMRCLVQMMKDSRMRRWTRCEAKDPSCSITNEAVFRAAAKCPLVLRKSESVLTPTSSSGLCLRNLIQRARHESIAANTKKIKGQHA